MTQKEALKQLMVVHRDSPIGREYEHFYTPESVHKVIDKLIATDDELVNKICTLYCKHCACCNAENQGCDQLIDFRSTLIKGML